MTLCITHHLHKGILSTMHTKNIREVAKEETEQAATDEVPELFRVRHSLPQLIWPPRVVKIGWHMATMFTAGVVSPTYRDSLMRRSSI